MKNLSAWIRRALLQLAAGVGICGAYLYVLGKAYLIVPLLVGCLVGSACWVVVGYRMMKSAGLEVDEAKKNMRFGFVVRLSLIMGVLIAAIRVSTETFWAVVAGLFFMSGILMVSAIVYAYNSNAGKEK